MIAISLTALLVASGMVLDFGLVRVDRQVNKSAADSAAMAGVHGLYNGNSNAYSYVGVCTAIRYLQNSGARFAGVSDSSGTWTDGTGAAAGNGCTTAALQSQVCSSTNLGDVGEVHLERHLPDHRPQGGDPERLRDLRLRRGLPALPRLPTAATARAGATSSPSRSPRTASLAWAASRARLTW